MRRGYNSTEWNFFMSGIEKVSFLLLGVMELICENSFVFGENGGVIKIGCKTEVSMGKAEMDRCLRSDVS